MTNRSTHNLVAAAAAPPRTGHPPSSILHPLLPQRRGSVMIMVVALLVLLAIMGTAYLASSRGDRVTSIQSQANQQVDHHVNGTIATLQQLLVDDLHGRIRTDVIPTADSIGMFQVPRYVPASLNNVEDTRYLRATGPYPIVGQFIRTKRFALGVGDFEHFDGPGRVKLPIIDELGVGVDEDLDGDGRPDTFDYDPDPWLADRTPVVIPSFRLEGGSRHDDPRDTKLSAERYAWRWISAPVSGIQGTNNYWEFDDPYGGAFYAPRKNLFPDVYPNGTPGLAWEVDPVKSAKLAPFMPAADTDGDGIADAFLSKLPGSTTNGLTTYVAWRVVDNAAAVNAAVAFEHKRNPSKWVTGDNFFPVNIGLAEPLGPGDTDLADPPTSLISRRGAYNDNELLRLQAFRAPDPNDSTKALIDPINPIGEGGNTYVRADFDFRDVYDAQWHQLGRRLALPGFNTVNSRFQRLPPADTLALAHGFVVGTDGLTLGSTTESLLFKRTNPFLWQPYTPAGYDDIDELWGDNNFADRQTEAHANAPVYQPSYGMPGRREPFVNARPLLVTTNAVSQAAPVHPSRPWTDGNFEYRVPFHPGIRPSASAHLPSGTILMPDMLDYDTASFYRGEYDRTRNYLPGEIVRAVNGSRTYICVAPVQDVDPTGLHHKDKGIAWNAQLYWEYQPYTPIPMKASLNTATFRELYRAFWNVMCNERDPDLHPLAMPPFNEVLTNLNNPDFLGYRHQDQNDPKDMEENQGWNIYPGEDQTNVGQMFRSSIRDNKSSATIRFNGKNQALLRAALAAVNAIDLRDTDDDVTSRTITLEMEVKTGSMANRPLVPVEVTVFGHEKQPYITRVYLNSFSTSNPNGYVLIELFNPHDTPISMSGWRLVTFKRGNNTTDRKGADTYSITRDKDFEIAHDTIPAHGHVYLTNFGVDATKHPADIEDPAAPLVGKKFVKINGSLNVNVDLFDREFVIVKPRRYSATATPVYSTSANYYDRHTESATNVHELVPVDQHDLSGVEDDAADPADPLKRLPVAYYYDRTHDNAVPPTNNRWKCVYPGEYDGDASSRRHEGTQYQGPSATSPEPRIVASGQIPIGGASTASWSDFPPIQLSNDDFAGPNPTPSMATTHHYPFGGFARVGDVLQVPYIGAYRIRSFKSTEPKDLIELNSISMDSSFVCDKDNTNNARENLGRFCPIPLTTSNTNVSKPSFYDWAKDIFDHFTVFAPYDDYFPNIVGGPPLDGNETDSRKPNYPGFLPAGPAPDPVATKFHTTSAAHDQPAEQAVEGLININTAPWRVLATVPWTTGIATGPDAAKYNYAIAKAIVRHREVNGPFKSIADLQNVRVTNVPSVSSGAAAFTGRFYQQLTTGDADLDDDQGDISPMNPTSGSKVLDGTGGGFHGDFEQQFLVLNRVSNLITTRSDSFTAYICLQQWENAGTPEARMVSQRRYAVLLDRSGVVKDKQDVKVSYIPIDGN